MSKKKDRKKLNEAIGALAASKDDTSRVLEMANRLFTYAEAKSEDAEQAAEERAAADPAAAPAPDPSAWERHQAAAKSQPFVAAQEWRNPMKVKQLLNELAAKLKK
jgi:hypothetical protein